MVGDVYYAAVVKSTVWQDAMSAAGLSLDVQDSGWEIGRGKRVVYLDAIEVMKLSLGVAFTGISPAGVARQISEYLGVPN